MIGHIDQLAAGIRRSTQWVAESAGARFIGRAGKRGEAKAKN